MGGTIQDDHIWDKEIQKLLTEIAEAEGFQDYRIENADGSMRGDGYIGIIKAIRIIDKNNKVLHLVVKSASKSDALRSQVPIDEIFERETYMYNTVFATFKAFESGKGLPPCNIVPKFYDSLSQDKGEILILENLKEIGYKLYERRIPMNEEHVSLVLTNYGRLHALSFALKDQNPEKFENISRHMNDHFIKYMLESGFIYNFITPCIKAQDAFDENKDKKVLNVYKAFIETIQPFFQDLLKSVDEYSVALHGDCWTNNMMFKYEDKVNLTKPTQVCFFDFQISRMGSPVLDLLYFFYTCSSKEIINNLDWYVKLYYKSFADYLQKLGSDSDKMFPYSVLQEHWKKYARYGLYQFSLYELCLQKKKKPSILLKNVKQGKALLQHLIMKLKRQMSSKKELEL